MDAAVVHLYDAALRLMRHYAIPFVPIERVREELDWTTDDVAAVVDGCVRGAPVVLGALVADWMFDGEQPAFGTSGARFIGIRPAP